MKTGAHSLALILLLRKNGGSKKLTIYNLPSSTLSKTEVSLIGFEKLLSILPQMRSEIQPCQVKEEKSLGRKSKSLGP